MDDLERLLKDILENDASSGTLCLALSKLRAGGHTGLVIRHCRKALETHPAHDGLRTLLAEAYLDSGLAARASDELERVTRNLDESAKAYLLLAGAYERQGRHEEAAGCLDIYLAHNPEDTAARESLESLRPPARETTWEPLETPEAERPDYPQHETLPEIATSTLAELYFSQGQIDAAVKTYEKVLAQSPDDSRGQARLQELKALTAASPDDASGREPGVEPAMEPPPAEDEFHEQAPVEAEKASASNSEKRKTEKMIAVLEGWLTRIQESRINASV
ncbi:MAG: tetratricopeptide repeat protein [Thermodesulfobacteriota bacterium]